MNRWLLLKDILLTGTGMALVLSQVFSPSPSDTLLVRPRAHGAKRRRQRGQPPVRAYQWAVLAANVVIWGTAIWLLFGGT